MYRINTICTVFYGSILSGGITMGLSTSALCFERRNLANYSPRYVKVPFSEHEMVSSLA